MSSSYMTTICSLNLPRLRAAALCITRDPEGASDVVQGVLVTLLEQPQSRRDQIRCLEAYALCVVKYRALEWLRTSWRETLMGDFDTLAIEHLVNERADPSLSNVDDVIRFVSTLPENCRAAFLLRRVHHHSVEAIATHLGISVRTVRRLLASASVELRRHATHNDVGAVPTGGLIYQTPEPLEVSRKESRKELIRSVQPKLIVVGAAIAERLQKNPRAMYTLAPREFEQLILEILRDRGHEAYLTPQTRDGGRDVLAYIDDDLYGRLLCLVEAKRYASHRKVGVDMVQRLYGTFSSEGASCAMLVTSSSFSAPARAFQVQHKYRLALKEYADIVKWIHDFGKK